MLLSHTIPSFRLKGRGRCVVIYSSHVVLLYEHTTLDSQQTMLKDTWEPNSRHHSEGGRGRLKWCPFQAAKKRVRCGLVLVSSVVFALQDWCDRFLLSFLSGCSAAAPPLFEKDCLIFAVRLLLFNFFSWEREKFRVRPRGTKELTERHTFDGTKETIYSPLSLDGSLFLSRP